VAAFRRADLDGSVLSQNVTDFTKTLLERGKSAWRIDSVKEPDHRHRRLLRVCRKRPRRRTTEKRDEIAASHHSITSLARAMNASDKEMPSEAAVLRFIAM